MRRSRPSVLAGAVGGLALTALLASCSAPASSGRSTKGSSNAQPAAVGPARITITPADQTQAVPLDAPVVVTADGGRLTSVSVQEAGSSSAPPAAMSSDAQEWRLTDGLDSGATYTITATATNGAGQSVTSSSTFSTLQAQGRLLTTISPQDGSTVGVGMPIDLSFNTPIPDSRKAALLERIHISSNPGVLGAWHWFSDSEVHFRTESYWPSGAKVTIAAYLKGFDAGNGVWGLGDWSRTFTIGAKHVSVIDDVTHQMQVYDTDKLIDTWPVSLGKPGFWTLSGTLVVLYKLYVVKMQSCPTFQTTAACVPGGANYYNDNVYYDTAISTNGFFIHAAPWSVYAQGYYDVSHGCVNLSTARAIDFWNWSQVGDVVIIKHTPNVADITNGEADWQIAFAQFSNTAGVGPIWTGAASDTSLGGRVF